MLFGIQSGKEYLENDLGWLASAMGWIGKLPKGARALMLREPRCLYCAPAWVTNNVLGRWLSERNVRSTAEKALVSWRVLKEQLRTLPVPEKFGDAYALFRVAR